MENSKAGAIAVGISARGVGEVVWGCRMVGNVAQPWGMDGTR